MFYISFSDNIFCIFNHSEYTALISDKLASFPLFYKLENEDYIILDYIPFQDKPKIDYDSVNEFLFAGYPIGSRTLLKDFNKLKSSEIVVLSKNSTKSKIECYYDHGHKYSFEELNFFLETKSYLGKSPLFPEIMIFCSLLYVTFSPS